MTELPKAGTPAGEAALANAREENAVTTREIERLEEQLSSLQGDERASVWHDLRLLETKRAVELKTIERLTFDRDKQLRAGVFPEDEDEIIKEIEGIQFDRNSSITWLGYGVDASANRDRLQSVAIAISRLKSAAHARMMERIRYRAMSAAVKPGAPLVW